MARAKSLTQSDRLKVIILAGFILFVFWSGVAVGMGFSHGHDSGNLPSGLEILRRHQNRATTTATSHLRIPTEPEQARCCDNNLVRCLACKLSISPSEYCFRVNPSHKDCNDELGSNKQIAKFNGFASQLFHTSSSSLDFPSVTLSAWVFLESGGPTQIKTILANRESGCDKDANHHGYALYVNEWDTADLSLNLMWSSDLQACEQLATPQHTIPYDKWTHVGAVLVNDLVANTFTAQLYVDGKQVASTVRPLLRLLAQDKQVSIGSHAGKKELHPFKGRIVRVSVESGVNMEVITKPFAKQPMYKSVLSTGIERVTLMPEPAENIDDPIDFLVPLGPIADVTSGAWPEKSFFLTEELRKQSDDLARERREVVRNAMKHAYGGYESKAFGADEVMPRTGNRKTNWGGMAMTLVDSLDTLWIMGMKDEFYRARDYTRDKMSFDGISSTISTFETTIRHLGGLMSAYDLSGDKAFLDRAVDLGERLAKAFAATNSGLPINNVYVNGNQQRGHGGNAVIAEVGTLQLEFRSLAYHSKQAKFAVMAENVHKKMREQPPQHGLWPMNVNLQTGHSSGGIVTFGAMGDSFFEYLIKVWHQGGKVEPEYLEDYERAMDGMHEYIVQRSSPSGLVYLGDLQPGGGMHHKMDHLACFVPAMLVLGVKQRGAGNAELRAKNDRDVVIAKALLYTCVQMYERQPTGIAPEYVDFRAGQDMVVPPSAPFYILRPETVESLYYLHQLTGHPVYRDWGHRIMMKLEKYCKLPYGYGAHPDVRDPKRVPDDRMESFFLAETLKYLFLLQDPDSEINLDEWVFNTEAHPLRVFPRGWRQELGI